MSMKRSQVFQLNGPLRSRSGRVDHTLHGQESSQLFRKRLRGFAGDLMLPQVDRQDDDWHTFWGMHKIATEGKLGHHDLHDDGWWNYGGYLVPEQHQNSLLFYKNTPQVTEAGAKVQYKVAHEIAQRLHRIRGRRQRRQGVPRQERTFLPRVKTERQQSENKQTSGPGWQEDKTCLASGHALKHVDEGCESDHIKKEEP